MTAFVCLIVAKTNAQTFTWGAASPSIKETDARIYNTFDAKFYQTNSIYNDKVFNRIVNIENYFSPSINNAIQLLLKKTLSWDEFDTQILLFLEKGIQTKDLPQYINLSLSSIEKRKASLKAQIFNQKTSDKELIEKCKTLKLI